MGAQRFRLIRRMAFHRPVGAFGAILLAFLLAFGCAHVTATVVAHERAIQREATSAFGAYAQQVTGSDDVADYMSSLQDRGEAVALAHSQYNILAPHTHRATTADVAVTSGPADLGVLIFGTHPSQPGEASVSRKVYEQLGVRLGSLVELVDVENTGLTATYKIVGVTEKPTSINEASAVAISENPAAFASSQVWLTNDDLAPLDNVLSHGGGDTATVSSFVNRTKAQAASYQAVSPQLAWLIGCLLVVALVTAIYAADRLRRRGVYRVLIALGDKPARAALTTCAQTTHLALVGGVAGWLLAVTTIPSFQAWIASLVEERWDHVAWGSITLAVLAVLAIVAAGGTCAAGLTVAANRHHRQRRVPSVSLRTLLPIGAIGTVATLLLVASRQVLLFPQGHRAAMIVGAVGIPFVAYAMAVLLHRRAVTTRLGNRLQNLTLVALVLVFALHYSGALYASSVANLTNGLAHQIKGEKSYLKVERATQRAITNLLDRYPQIADKTAVFGDISTGKEMFRLTDGEGAFCFSTATTIEDCPQARLDMVYVAAKGLAEKRYAGHAPATYVTKNHQASVIGIGVDTPAVTRLVQIDNVRGDEELDNNILSGLVLPPDAPILADLGASTPSSYTAVIKGFGDLSDDVRDGVRSTVLAQAPFATVTDSDDPENRQLQALAVVRQLFALIVSGTLLLALIATIVSDQRTERRLIELMGGGWRLRLALVRPLLLSYAITVITAVVLGRLAAMDRIPFTFLDIAVPHD